MTMVAVAGSLVAAGAALAALADTGASQPTTEAAIAIHYSKFQPGRVTVPAGVPVTFVLANNDPIEHEWIVGDEATHARHRTGTEPYHDQVPTEVTLRAYETRTTVVVFDAPGEYTFVCHLPGHEQFGMKGVVRVVD